MKLAIALLIINCFSSFGQAVLQDPGDNFSKRWLLNDRTSKKFKIIPYKPVYFLLANYTTNINNFPVSDNPINSVEESSEFSNTELKFQLSFKTRDFKNLLGRKIGGDLWIGYNQSSRWQ